MTILAQIEEFNYSGSIIRRRTTDGYMDLTQMCQVAGKRLDNFLRTAETEQYIKALEKEMGAVVLDVKKGGANQGTWGHPGLAINLARWISPRFAVWCDAHIFNLMSTGKTDLKTEPIAEMEQLRQAMEFEPRLKYALEAAANDGTGKIAKAMNEARFEVAQELIALSKSHDPKDRELLQFITTLLEKAHDKAQHELPWRRLTSRPAGILLKNHFDPPPSDRPSYTLDYMRARLEDRVFEQVEKRGKATLGGVRDHVNAILLPEERLSRRWVQVEMDFLATRSELQWLDSDKTIMGEDPAISDLLP